MKRSLSFILSIFLFGSVAANAQDSAVEERLNRLAGQVEDLIAAHKTLQKQINDTNERIEKLREHVNKPNTSYLTSDDIRPLVDAIKEVDRKRIADAEVVQSKLNAIQKAVAAAPVASTRRSVEKAAPERPEKGYEYEIQSGDNLSSIITACREQNVKVTLDQIMKANPGLKPNALKVGQKIFIPTN